jgi:nitrous oxidase accessory protein NosD
VDVGLAASGQPVASPGSTSFVNNQVTGKPGSTGVYVTTDQFGYGSGNVNATFTGNTITGHVDGFYIEAQMGYTATVNATGNSIFGNSVSGATTTGTGTHSATMEDNWWGSASGPQHPSNTFNVPTQGNAVVGNADFVPWLDAAPPTGVSFAPVTTTSPVDDYASIQAGANGSNPGGTVDAKAGTFDEQVVIGKSLTLQGPAPPVVKPSSAPSSRQC